MPANLWRAYGLETPEKEYRFHPTRKWRFDFAWPKERVALEIEGGIWTRGAHVRGAHFLSDCEKYNTAALLGWRVFRFTPEQLNKGDVYLFLEKVLKQKGE